MSSATTDSTTWSVVRLIARLLISEALTPVTTTVAVSSGSVLSAAACAHTEALLSRPAPMSAVTVSFKDKGRADTCDFIRLLCF